LFGVGDGGFSPQFRSSPSLRGAKRRDNLPRYCQALLGVGDGGFDLHFCPEGKNYGIDQCLHWSKQHATGLLHLHGFESTSPAKRKTPSERMVFFIWWTI
jgi:hypothetical protein